MQQSKSTICWTICTLLCAAVFVSAQDCESNGRTTVTGTSCCFPAVYQGQTYNDCWSIEDDPYCSTSSRATNRTTMAKCMPRDTTNNNTIPTDAYNSLANAFGAPPATSQEALDRLGGAFEPESMAPTTSEPAVDTTALAPAFDEQQTAATRYTVDDQLCLFPITFNQTTYYNCFDKPGLLDTDSEASSATGQQYCFVSNSPDVPAVQCAQEGYTPTDNTAPAGVCPEQTTRTTVNGKTCTFPQRNAFKEWVCDCYSLTTMQEATSDSELNLACIPDGEESPAQCMSMETTSTDNTTSNSTAPSTDTPPSTPSAPGPSSSSSNTQSTTTPSSGSSSNALAIGLGVGIPLALLAIGGLIGGVWWYKKKRPMAKATSFAKWDGGNTEIKGGAISSKDIAKSGTGLSEVSHYAEQL